VLYVSDVARSATFWQGLGLRPVGQDENVAVLELRGGTHLVVLPGEPECGTDAYVVTVNNSHVMGEV